MAGIVDHDVEPAILGDDLGDAGLYGFVGRDIQLDGPEVDASLGSIARNFGDLRRVAPGRLAHRGVDGVAGLGERAGGKRAEAARRAGNDDNLFHDCNPSM